MSKKLTIQKGTVQETLLIPLYGRKICNEVFPKLYSDPWLIFQSLSEFPQRDICAATMI